MLMTILRVVLIILALVMIGVCTLVSGKAQGGAGSALGGGAGGDNYFSRNKNQGKDARMHAIMKLAATVFVILSVVMVIIQ